MAPPSNDDTRARIGPAAERLGLSPRMVRYLEEQGVLRPERGPGPRGHRHYPPPELALAAAAVLATQAGHPSATLRALRDLADGRVRAARSSDDPLAWFELVALARAVDAVVRDEVGPPGSPGDTSDPGGLPRPRHPGPDTDEPS
jgi:DNA-binding transcriptional MerR regulator